MTPLGRNVLLDLLPETPRSTLIYTEGLGAEGLVQRGVIRAVGPRCRYATVGQTVLCRITLGTKVGDHLLLPETACLAEVEA